MSGLSAESLQSSMLDAVGGALGKGGQHISKFARAEFKLLAHSIVEIQTLVLAGELTRTEAKSLMRQHKYATTAILSGIRGMTFLVAEQTVNSAIRAIKGVVNSAVGFALL